MMRVHQSFKNVGLDKVCLLSFQFYYAYLRVVYKYFVELLIKFLKKSLNIISKEVYIEGIEFQLGISRAGRDQTKIEWLWHGRQVWIGKACNYCIQLFIYFSLFIWLLSVSYFKHRYTVKIIVLIMLYKCLFVLYATRNTGEVMTLFINSSI